MLTLAFLPLLAALGIIAWTAIRYFQDPHHLRRFPSPSIAALTPLWSMYHSWNGTQYKSIRIAHERLGPIVRIAPNHISFIDPAAYKDIYGHGAPTRKDDFYSHISGDNPSMAQATDKSVHAAKRRSLAHVFSAKEITAMEPRVIDCVKNLLAALKVKAEGGKIGPGDAHEVMDEVFDLRPWLNMFSYDAISSMFFTNSYDFLKQGNDVCSSTDSSGKTKCVQAMDTFHSASRFNTAMAQLPLPLYKLGRKVLWFVHGNQSGSDFEGMSRAQVQSRLSNEPKKSDLFSRLPITATEKRPNPMAVKEIIAECATMLDAGNDTTQTTLANCMYHLATNPVKQERLHRELAAIVLAEDKNTRVPPTTILQQVPYLRAVLEENWRCRPPVARGLPRRTIGEGTNIAGHFFGPGVTVSAPVWELHRNASLFRQPLEFIPERWMPDEEFGQDMEEASNLKNYCIPFSLGPRACIGRNLAYMEVSIVVAALILNFKWELSEKDVEMPIMERFNCNPKELMVKAKMRS